MLRELQQEIAVLQATKAELQAKIIIKDTEHRILIQNYAAAHAVPPVALSCTTSSSCVLGVMSAQRQLHEALRIEYERQRARGSTPQVSPTIGHLQTPSAAPPHGHQVKLRSYAHRPSQDRNQPQRVSGGRSPALSSRMSAAAATQQQQLRPFTHQQEQDLSEQNNGKRVSGNLLLMLLLLALHH
jgi:hypothetical protein